ncbi:uncharacterized protein [Halyomorpha halys]|nr:uncharacterized protein LOC106682645 isoform X2 [Halyomorpha halys]XP_014279101.1 uncharacterized protein LOC106682645 isoform X2 [Halyomorpha halys]XP_014279102.1 uncharacterized protein LOC106682645 isoform X2 [Halyomorpha halys]XP_014279103.1 uncharacterized protein LOC106682645 isoform X2 [Halyomorpha halys]XP_014279106.1 uncharacterized protein LOC106682645 isoform X2 [Halyomorpha halys]XP_014279107.1 uncharacterized protein LOC106682645 isoform X2 [Halyomorpha halys]
MTWCSCLIIFFRKCCGKKSNEFECLTNDQLGSFQSTYTVRRISSFGHTIINENGEESEIGRHSSILTYDGETVPWSSKPAPVQPGVTHSDIMNQIKKLPTINESPKKVKNKHKWKKADSSNKKDLFQKFYKDNCISQDLLLTPLKRNDKPHSVLESNSVSQDDLFSKCKNKIENKQPLMTTLTIPKGTLKSLSSPDLAHCDTQQPNMIMSKEYPPALSVSDRPRSKWEPTDDGKNSKIKEAERIAKLYGLDLALYTEEALRPLNIKKGPDMVTILTWTEEPAGTLDVSLNINSLQKQLMVTINAIQSLSGEGIEQEPFESIIKLTLLSKKKIVKSSKRIIASFNTKIDQTFSFSTKDIDSRAIRFSVYNAEWQGKYDAVGHSLLPIHDSLHSIDNLILKIFSQSSLEKSTGMMQITFGYDGTSFNITIDKIFNFDPKLRKCKLYIKISYYSQSKKIKEKSSPLSWTETGSEEINFDYSTSFKINASGKSHSCIVVSLKSNEDYAMFKQDKVVGRVILGPYFYSESGNHTPWGRAIINKQTLCYYFKLIS